MWATAKPLLILLSVALNGAFVTAWVSHRIPPRPCPDADGGIVCPLHAKLGVTPSQMQKIGPCLAEFRKASGTQCRKLQQLRGGLIDLLAAEQPDREAIRAKQEEIVVGQRRLQQLVVEQLLAEKANLTVQQQKALFDMIRVQCGCPEEEAEDCSSKESK